MNAPVCRILSPGVSATMQDFGRPGWRRFGIPSGGAMDPHAAAWANRLVGNPDTHPVLELAWQGADLLVLRDAWFALTGAEAGSALPAWSAAELSAGSRLAFPQNRGGLWTYVAVAGGWVADRWLGSASVYPRGQLGRPLQAGDELSALRPAFPPAAIARRAVRPEERPDYLHPNPFPLQPGPQSALFTREARALLVEATWKIAAQSDRTGFRLEGPALQESVPEITSEPVLPGSLQVPGNGRPIVTMPDGPTVGGYAMIAWLAEEMLGRLAQCRPGTEVRFRWASRLVLNCDLGEGESPKQTEALMRCIGAANIACGGHAGDADSIRRCLRLCRKFTVLPGAHPGLRADFGRGDTECLSPDDLRALLEEQLGFFDGLLAEAGMELHHVKLHGSLYHAVEQHDALASAFLKVLQKRPGSAVIFCLAGGAFADRARAAGVEVWEEAFADRHYAEDGTLLPRNHPDALVTDPNFMRERFELLAEKGEIQTREGTVRRCRARTLCVHSDTPGGLEALRALHALVESGS